MDSNDTRDILYDKDLPLCLREFILHHGGVEGLRAEVSSGLSVPSICSKCLMESFELWC